MAAPSLDVPPRVPRSLITPADQTNACVCPLAVVLVPTICPASLIARRPRGNSTTEAVDRLGEASGMPAMLVVQAPPGGVAGDTARAVGLLAMLAVPPSVPRSV